MKKKKQILLIHGGSTFKNGDDYLRFLKMRKISITKKLSWTGDYLDRQLGKSYDIIRPRMPLQDNATYNEWKIHFERFFPFLRNDIILIGSSLGGIFLAKYLSENKFPKKVLVVFLIAPPFDNTLAVEDLAGGFRLKSNLSLIEKNVHQLYLLFSKDDKVVPPSHAEKYQNKLRNAKTIIYKSKNGHFNISTFPEIVALIRNIEKRK